LARRGMVATSQSISADLRAETPMLRAGVNEPWIDRDWLVAPVLKSRDRSLGVIAVRRPVEIGFGPEDREVLTLLSQMASSALGATELARNIAASEDRLRVLIDTAPIGIVEVDLDGQVRYWNPAASRILAWREFTGTEVAPPTFPAATLAELRQLWAEATAGETINVRDIAGVKVAGRTRTLTVSAAPLPSSDGRAAGMLTLVDDVTNHRELKAELRHAHTMEIRGQVASRIAHDFNNLLTLISGYAEILGRDLESDERSAQMVEEIQSTASRASLLTSQLQAIGRTKVAEPVVFDPMAVIQSNAEVLERILGSKIEVQWSFGEPIGNIRTDADQFEQMILNLSINARDAMPDGGTLKFSVAPANLDSEAAAARALASGQYVKVLVSDTGLGMDSATLEKCFEPLFTTKGPFKGTGMGLASARRLMEESGGAIWCDSQLGHGTTFEIVFPLIDEPAQETSARPEVVRARGHATILIVEDDDGLRRLMSTVLKRNGYQVFEAESGESAIDVSRHIEAPIDLLLSDVVMGEMSGRDLASLLQSEHPSMRVLLVSGTEDRSVIDGLLAGSGSFLAKPFKPSQLIDEVHELLTRED
jgi:two-component system cell cycle sensor histidine kinase/response regulator CckA